jgi:hypothetical protein
MIVQYAAMKILLYKMDANISGFDDYESQSHMIPHNNKESELIQDTICLTCPTDIQDTDDSSLSRTQYDPTNCKANVKSRRRTCKFANCHRVVKSQGLCQRHGARTKLCRAVGCEKQAQGGFEGFCSKSQKWFFILIIII